MSSYAIVLIKIPAPSRKEKAKDLAAIIKGLNLKVQTQIEGEKLKVSSPKKDDLQAVIAHLRSTA